MLIGIGTCPTLVLDKTEDAKTVSLPEKCTF